MADGKQRSKKVRHQLIGQRFERLVVTGERRSSVGDNAKWICRCDCGNEVFVGGHKLTTGQVKSCGCMRAGDHVHAANKRRADGVRRMIEAVSADPNARPLGQCCIRGCDSPERSMAFCSHHYDMWNRYGHPLSGELVGRRALTQGARTKERKAWSAMKSRCHNPNVQAYPGYGGRGIIVCDRWRESFENFYADMGDAPVGTSLERKDVNGNYEPGNCAWATSTEQMRNTRYTKLTEETVLAARKAYSGGESVVTISKQLGVSYGAIYAAVTGRSWADVEAAGSG